MNAFKSRHNSVVGVVVVLLPLLAACDRRQECVPFIAPGVIVHVTNVDSGADICDAKVTATERTHGHSYDLQPGIQCRYQDFGVTVGTYDVRVERPGFVPQTISGVVVVSEGGACGVLVTQFLSVPLAPAP